MESIKSAQALILTGKVIVNNEKVTKPGTKVSGDCSIRVTEPLSNKYVSRGGMKLEGALDEMAVDVSNKVIMDVGISTGGFTDCVIQRGAAAVIGIDVGYGQVDYRLQTDDRVIIIERCNARYVALSDVKKAICKHGAPNEWAVGVELVVMDLSFISVEKVLPNITQFCTSDALYLVLIKPQFESKKDEIGDGGVIADRAVSEQIVDRCVENLHRSGFQEEGRCLSKVKGAKKGNQEYWILLSNKGV